MTIALFILAFFAGGLLVHGISKAPAAEEHPATVGVCTPSRARLLTGANLSREQIVAIQQDDEELQRLRAVIRQRNRVIKQLRAQLGQPGNQPVPVGNSASRFEGLEIRGRS